MTDSDLRPSEEAGGILRRFRLDGRKAIVTGGSRNMGRQIAIGLAEAGANVAVVDLPAAEGEAGNTVSEIEARGCRGCFVALDVRDVEAIPGGYELAFRGADRVQRQQRKIEKFLQAYNLVRMQGTIMQPWILDRMLLEVLEVFSGQELDDLGLTPEMQQQMQMPQQQMQPPGFSVGATTAVQNPETVGMGQPMGLAA